MSSNFHFAECIDPLIAEIVQVLENGGKGRLCGVRLSGKSAIARRVCTALMEKNKLVILLDFCELHTEFEHAHSNTSTPLPPHTALKVLLDSITRQCQLQGRELRIGNIPKLNGELTGFGIQRWWFSLREELSKLQAVVIADNIERSLIVFSSPHVRFILSRLLCYICEAQELGLGLFVVCDGSIESEIAIRGGPSPVGKLSIMCRWSPCVVTEEHAFRNSTLQAKLQQDTLTLDEFAQCPGHLALYMNTSYDDLIASIAQHITGGEALESIDPSVFSAHSIKLDLLRIALHTLYSDRKGIHRSELDDQGHWVRYLILSKTLENPGSSYELVRFKSAIFAHAVCERFKEHIPELFEYGTMDISCEGEGTVHSTVFPVASSSCVSSPATDSSSSPATESSSHQILNGVPASAGMAVSEEAELVNRYGNALNIEDVED